MISTSNKMEALLTGKQNVYASVAFNPAKKTKMYTHSVSLSDGTTLQIESAVSILCSYSIDEFRQQGEKELARRKMKERYLAKKAKQNST